MRCVRPRMRINKGCGLLKSAHWWIWTLDVNVAGLGGLANQIACSCSTGKWHCDLAQVVSIKTDVWSVISHTTVSAVGGTTRKTSSLQILNSEGGGVEGWLHRQNTYGRTYDKQTARQTDRQLDRQTDDKTDDHSDCVVLIVCYELNQKYLFVCLCVCLFVWGEWKAHEVQSCN